MLQRKILCGNFKMGKSVEKVLNLDGDFERRQTLLEPGCVFILYGFSKGFTFCLFVMKSRQLRNTWFALSSVFSACFPTLGLSTTTFRWHWKTKQSPRVFILSTLSLNSNVGGFSVRKTSDKFPWYLRAGKANQTLMFLSTKFLVFGNFNHALIYLAKCGSNTKFENFWTTRLCGEKCLRGNSLRRCVNLRVWGRTTQLMRLWISRSMSISTEEERKYWPPVGRYFCRFSTFSYDLLRT